MTKLEGTQLENFTPLGKQKIEQLTISDTVIGDGVVVEAKDATVTVHYTGALCATGEIFQSSKDFGEPITFGLNQVIQGWTDGVPGMKVGGVRRLKIPSAMAYGSVRAAANIPPNSDLVFDIELIDAQG